MLKGLPGGDANESAASKDDGANINPIWRPTSANKPWVDLTSFADVVDPSSQVRYSDVSAAAASRSTLQQISAAEASELFSARGLLEPNLESIGAHCVDATPPAPFADDDEPEEGEIRE